MNKCIGLFDSGIGGLSILKECIKTLSQYDYMYYGDNANVPYGNKSSVEIYELTLNAVDFLFRKNCHLVVLACNTATAGALRRLQQEYLPNQYPDRRILGVIRPVTEQAAQNNAKKIGVIATSSTVKSGSFPAELKKLNSEIEIYQNECPLLVPLIEQGPIGLREIDDMLHSYLKPLIDKKIDTLILGCTHYGLIAEKIQKIVGPKIRVLAENEIVVLKLKDYIKRHPEIEKNISKKWTRIYYVTKLNEEYRRHIHFFLGTSPMVSEVDTSIF